MYHSRPEVCVICIDAVMSAAQLPVGAPVVQEALLMLSLACPQPCHQSSVYVSVLLTWFCSSCVMPLPLSIAARLLPCLQVQVRRRSGRARVEEQAFRLTAPGAVEMLTAEQAAALQQKADAQQAAGEPARIVWAAAQHALLEKRTVGRLCQLNTAGHLAG